MELTREAIDLLLQVLEGREAMLAGATATLHPDEVRVLVEQGLLRANGHEDVAALPHAEEEGPVPLFPWTGRSGLAGFDPTSGVVPLPAEQLTRWAVDMQVVLNAVVADLDLPTRWRPQGLVDGLVWELGEVRLGRRPQRHSLWFMRRLWNRAEQPQMEAALAARPHPRMRILLTSSRRERLDRLHLRGTAVVPLRDVLTTPDNLSVSGEILDAKLSGLPASEVTRPIALLDGGRTLSINGETVFTFKSPRQIAAIGKLVAAYEQGRGLTVGELTEHGSPDRIFGIKRWKQLSPYIKSREGLWRLEP